MKWINIKNKLPKDGQHILMWELENWNDEEDQSGCFDIGYYNSYKERWENDYGNEITNFDITHWMIPKRPKDLEGEK